MEITKGSSWIQAPVQSQDSKERGSFGLRARCKHWGMKFGLLTRSSFRMVSASVALGNVLEVHNLIAKGVANQAAHGMGTELVHDIAAVGFDRVNTEPQGCSDLLVTLLLGQ